MIIYGGSFNPPTKAHKKIVKKLEKKFKTKVYILPTSKKNYPHKHNLEEDNIRLEMLKLLFQKNTILEDELKDTSFKGTYHLLKKYKNKEDIYFVMGEDNLKNIDKWLESKKLINEFKFIIITRDKAGIKLPNKNFIKIKIKSNISSTKARRKPNRKYITKKVLEYIKEHRLYGGNNV